MKIAVFGSNGMAGHIIVKYLRQCGHSVTTLARSGADIEVDIEDTGTLPDVLNRLRGYDFIINSIGLLVKDSIERPDRAAVINSWFPHHLEYSFKDSNTKLVHLSTDCVFDGKTGNYKEIDPHTEMNAYGRSKSLGEINNSKDVTFRMSIIGPELKKNGTGLLLWATTTADSTINGYVDAWWNGITTLQLAKCIEQHIQNPQVSGVYHLVNNNNSINKYDLLCLINEIYRLDKKVLRTTGPKVVNKILIDTRLKVDWGIPDYRTQLLELLEYSKK